MNPFRGLFGSSAREFEPGDGGTFIARADPTLDDPITRQLGVAKMKRPPVMNDVTDRNRMERATALALFSAGLADAGTALQGGEGKSLSRVQEGFRKRREAEQKSVAQERLQKLAGELYGDDKEAQLLFMADPKSFVKARAERLKPQTLSGGQTYRDPFSGETFSAPIFEKFDDRFGGLDPNTGQSFFTAPRGPTFNENTGRMNADEARRHNRQTEGIGWSNANRSWAAHRARMAAGGYGTPGVGMGFVPDDDVEIID